MGTVDKLKERMNKNAITEGAKQCPICGASPALDKRSLDFGNGHGYPGCHAYQYKCSKCGIIKSEETYDIGDDEEELTAEQRALKDWNETVDYINSLIENRDKQKKGF